MNTIGLALMKDRKRNFVILMLLLIGFTLFVLLSTSLEKPTYALTKFQVNHTNRWIPIRQANFNICCLILTTPKNFESRTRAIQNTWAPRCDVHYFVSEDDQKTRLPPDLPFAPLLDLPAGYDHLTQKSVRGLLFAYEHHANTCQWFVKADDDTYLIVDHLRAFLREQNATEPITFGYNFKVIVEGGYHSGGGSYVLSREALRRFNEAHQDPNSGCVKDGGPEDVQVARCLRNKGVHLGKSLDQQGRELFHPLNFNDHFQGNFPDWLHSYAENPLRSGSNCCSDQTISFHYVPPDQQYMIDFLLYRARSPPTVNMNRS